MNHPAGAGSQQPKPLHCNSRDCSQVEKIHQEGDKPQNRPNTRKANREEVRCSAYFPYSTVNPSCLRLRPCRSANLCLWRLCVNCPLLAENPGQTGGQEATTLGVKSTGPPPYPLHSPSVSSRLRASPKPNAQSPQDLTRIYYTRVAVDVSRRYLGSGQNAATDVGGYTTRCR